MLIVGGVLYYTLILQRLGKGAFIIYDRGLIQLGTGRKFHCNEIKENNSVKNISVDSNISDDASL